MSNPDTYIQITPGSVPVTTFHAHMLGAVAPRPIALASTLDSKGIPNLSPFSFYNAMGANPPVMVFSPARRARNNTTKHTFENVKANMEVVINAVSYDMVEQVSLASCEYPDGVNEFIKSGLTPIPSQIVKPFGVAESPARFECVVTQIIETGTEGGAGNIVICEVKLMHIKKEVLTTDGKIDPQKIQLVSRLGGDWYARAFGNALFEVPKPNVKLGIGIDQLPEKFFSLGLTKNELARLANIEQIPTPEEILEQFKAIHMQDIDINAAKNASESSILALQKGRAFLESGELLKAWVCLYHA
jgi:flavin reductase (DIM6/NTAB) family NADH-FMN oxidoreductase RutF